MAQQVAYNPAGLPARRAGMSLLKTWMMAAALLLGLGTVTAQGGGFPRKTVPERVQEVMAKLAEFNLDKDKTAQTEATFTTFYTNIEKMMEEMRGGGGRPDREVVREKRQKLVDERDGKLKGIFTEEQYNKWKNEIEPSMRPNRGPGGGQR
jgi:periplasmic protein CpxP/Spy